METESIHDILINRYYDLLISYDFARKQRALSQGLEDDLEHVDEAHRHLLDVEVTARESRQVAAFSKAVNQQEAAVILHQEIEDAFEEAMGDIEHVAETIVGIHDSVPAALDILSVKASTIGRVEPLIANQSWLANDMLKFVNLPAYSRNRTGNKRVDKLHTALSYVGLENLPFVLPSFALRHWIPHSTEPFRLMKRKLWESGLGAAICCKKLASTYGENEAALFTAGMFHDLGSSAVVRVYLRLYNDIWQASLIKARDDRDKKTHDALVDLEPDPTHLRKLIIEYSAGLSAGLMEHFNLKRLMVLGPLEEIASPELKFEDMSVSAQVLSKGIAFSRYKMMQKHNLLNKEEAKAFFKAEHIPTVDIIELRKLSLKRLNLQLQT